MECCIQNADIHYVDVEPAYWDGRLQVLVRDENTRYYNIIGAKYISKGEKLNICPLSISGAIFNNEHLPVSYDELQESWRERYQKSVEENRKTTRDIGNDVERGFFIEYLVKRLVNFGEDMEKTEVVEAAEKFYNTNMNYEDKMPDDIVHLTSKDKDGRDWILSWHERRLKQWDREIGVDFTDG